MGISKVSNTTGITFWRLKDVIYILFTKLHAFENRISNTDINKHRQKERNIYDDSNSNQAGIIMYDLGHGCKQVR